MDARAEALRLGEYLGWVCLPLYDRGGKWILPVAYKELAGPFAVELWEQLWDGHDEAPGLGALWPEDVVEVEADSDEGTEWIRARKPPRTPAFASRRGPHYLFRATEEHASTRPHPGVEVLSREAGKRLLVLPPTPPKAWMPSLSPYEVELVPLPPAFAVRVQSNGQREKVRVRRASEIPPGEAHDRMISMLGKLGRVLSRPELEVAAARLNEGRLPEDELARIVEHVLAEEGDAGRYFDRGTFLPAILGAELAEAYETRVGPGPHLYWYRDGVFRSSGRERVEQATRRVLGARFHPRHAHEVHDYLTLGHPEIPEEPSPDLINVANGMLDWRTGELLPHSPEHLSIIQLPVRWNVGATCPGVDTFLSEVLPADAQRFVREAIGYTSLPEARLRKAIMLLGTGSNGKSTFISLVRRMLGRRNVSSVPLQNFGESRFAAADVYGKLANLCGDLDARALRRTDLFKTLTGGTDQIRVERKYEHAFDFVPFATLIFSANEPPASSDQSDAYFDRWLIFPFDRRFEGAEVDQFLLDKLTTREELEGLLVQAVSGLIDLMERGRFDLPPSVVAANEEYRSKVDTVSTFLDEAVERGLGCSVTRAVLYEGYRDWCQRNGRMPVSQQSFAPRLRQLLCAEIATEAVAEGVTHGVRNWKGLKIRG